MKREFFSVDFTHLVRAPSSSRGPDACRSFTRVEAVSGSAFLESQVGLAREAYVILLRFNYMNYLHVNTNAYACVLGMLTPRQHSRSDPRFLGFRG